MPLSQSEYGLVSDLMTPEEFESKVVTKVKEWAGLLDRRAAALLVVDEAGRLTMPFMQIKDLQDGSEVSVRGTVESISQVRGFTRRTGESGRVVNIEVSDSTGRCKIVLWDDDVSMVESGAIKVGSVVRALDCYVRRSNFGLEVSRGKFGTMLIEG